MFLWYRNASTCFAYLCDVPGGQTEADCAAQESSFRASKWFTRGWTLQELLAPLQVEFVAQDWETVIGTKRSLRAVISSVTSIPERCLAEFTGSTVPGRKIRFYYSVAEILSWASKRVTTRKEDIAYSLMGLFGIHIPILYGEGSAAFLRLQTEILKLSDDESIFTWSSDNWPMDPYMKNGLLAPSPSLFSGCSFKPSRDDVFEDFDETLWDAERPPYSMTNKGLKIKPLLIQGGHPHVDSLLSPVLGTSSASLVMKHLFIMPLNCRSPKSQLAPALCLMRLFANEYARVSNVMMLDYNSAEWLDKGLLQRRTLYIRQTY
jgi:hypothetical protein